jgi:hypothetical protein
MMPFAYRVNVSAAFPTQVVAIDGVEVTKKNGIYTIGSAYEALAALSAIPIPDEKMVKVWDRVSGVYNTMPLSIVVGGASAFSSNIVAVQSGAGYLAANQDDIIIVEKTASSPTNVTMVASATRTRGPVYVKDGKGDADVNNITVLFNGTEKSDGFSSIVIRTKFGGAQFAPNPTGGWVTMLFG